RYIDVDGNVKVDGQNGTQITISASQILGAVRAAGVQVKTAHQARTVSSISGGGISKRRKYKTYRASQRGDLLTLAFDKALRGSGAILPLQPVTPYYLNFGVLESSMGRMNREKGVHGTRTLKSTRYNKKGQYGMPGYPQMEG